MFDRGQVKTNVPRRFYASEIRPDACFQNSKDATNVIFGPHTAKSAKNLAERDI